MIERQIIIGLITSTEYCQKIQGVWNTRLLDSAMARRIAGWCWDYFDKYHKAPGSDIETIYYNAIRENQIPKNLAEEIEQDILPGLSKEYGREGLDITPLLDSTDKYLNAQHLKLFTAMIDALSAEGKQEEAEKLVRDFKPLNSTRRNLDAFIVPVERIRERRRRNPRTLLQPWLKEGQTTILYGNYGSGKSLLSIAVSYMLGLRDYETDEAEIGTWLVKNPTGTLYIDGELGEQEMEERIKGFEWLGKQSGKYRIQVLSLPEYQLDTGDSFSLSDRENQIKVIHWLEKHPNYKVVVLDSISTLFNLEEENSNSEWNNKVNPFIRDLRALKVACLLLHHAGKDSKKGLRGASSMGAMAHNIFRLTPHRFKDPDKGEAWFTLTKDKQRAAGYHFGELSLRFFRTENDVETHWEITGGSKDDDD